MILFGGERDGGGALDDLWVLKGLGTEALRSAFPLRFYLRSPIDIPPMRPG